MNKKILLITAASVTVIVYMLFILGCFFDESPNKALFDRMYRPILHVIIGPVSWLVLLVFGQESKHNALLVGIAIPILSGILWGFVAERTAFLINKLKQKA